MKQNFNIVVPMGSVEVQDLLKMVTRIQNHLSM